MSEMPFKLSFFPRRLLYMYELWIHKMLINSKKGEKEKGRKRVSKSVISLFLLTSIFSLLSIFPFSSSWFPVSIFELKSSFGAKEEFREIWGIIKFYGRVVGYSVIRVRDDRDFSVKVDERLEMKLKAMGDERHIKTSLEWEGGSDFSLRSFSFLLKSEGVENQINGKVEGNTLIIKVGKSSSSQNIKIREKVFTGSSFLFLLEKEINSLIDGGNDGRDDKSGSRVKASKEKKAADKTYDKLRALNPSQLSKIDFSIDYFDPSVLRLDVMRLRYHAKEGKYFIFIKEFAGLSSFLFFDENGKFVKEEGPAGVSSEVSSREEVMNTKLEEMDIIFSTSVKAEGDKLPPSHRKDREKIKTAVLEISGVDSIPSFPPRQFVMRENGVLKVILKSEFLDGLKDAEDMGQFSRAEPLIESDSDEIRRLALKIAGREIRSQPKGDEAVALMRKVSDWVFRNIRKTSSLGMPSALDVLRSGEGDCNEHAVLATAILRSMKIPARIVFGLVYNSGYFFYHAWVEGFDGKKWIEFDPTWGYFPADVLRIRLGTGNISEWAKVLEYVGRIKIKFLDFN